MKKESEPYLVKSKELEISLPILWREKTGQKKSAEKKLPHQKIKFEMRQLKVILYAAGKELLHGVTSREGKDEPDKTSRKSILSGVRVFRYKTRQE